MTRRTAKRQWRVYDLHVSKHADGGYAVDERCGDLGILSLTDHFTGKEFEKAVVGLLGVHYNRKGKKRVALSVVHNPGQAFVYVDDVPTFELEVDS